MSDRRLPPPPEFRPDPEITPTRVETRSFAARTGAVSANSLVALGTAAVIAVYAAGYQRTKPAADLWAAESGNRRVAAAPVRISPDTISQLLAARQNTPAPSQDSATVVTASVNSARTDTTAKADVVKQASAVTAAPVTAAPVRAVPVHAAPVRAAGVNAAPVAAPVTTTATMSESAADHAPTGVPTSVPTSVPAPATPTPAPAAMSAVAVPAATTTPAALAYRDGMFIGYGTSRHGDIEAMVEIKDGRIISAVISRCLTRYSCSWIAALPPQVVTRQSADVDYVSGATQSANAFYYAVTQALQQAK